MVFKGFNWVHNDNTGSNGLERSHIGYRMIKFVLKGVNWVYNTIIRSNGLERSQLGRLYKSHVIWS